MGELDPMLGQAILQAADEVKAGELYDHVPPVVWQTEAGIRSNTNAKVIANPSIRSP